MSSTLSPPHKSGYASPAPSSATPPITKPNAPSKPKPTNVFSNDGSFLERFQRIKKDEEETRKQEEILARYAKRNFDERFKKRGKRPPLDASNSDSTIEPSRKKRKTDEPMTSYHNQVRNYADRSLKDDGIGVRPLVK
ncbi:uncharacterized protein FIBRA_00527 [Fibroporia radiculosa]|uniref:Uncharacterized protein n=1 Tax=Fibroporia radiculosa TaxID=599839 RepID=J4G0D1_9APHY|nr:uncharacterized protein FIBRA_00527 [Fibroporia radiculosa]CCL98528.1 predicted protein [Fibroporia radiculosa]